MGEPLLQLDAAACRYPGPPPVDALTPTTLEIAAGDYLAIIGPSGAGKSTLLNILGLLVSPTSGSLRVRGQDARQLNDAARSRLRGEEIGFVFQSFNLLAYHDAVDNVALPLVYHGISRTSRRATARRCLERVGLGHRLDAHPRHMSGGERQRVAIARAIVADPSILLCDEPTGNLDSRFTGEILAVIEGLRNEGVATVIVTHDPDIAARADRVITVCDGVADEAAPHAEPSRWH